MNNTEIILFSIIGFYACYCSIFVISLCKEYDIPQFTIEKLKYLYGKCKDSCCRKKRIRYAIVGEVEVEAEDENDTTNANISIDDNGITDDDENNVQIKMPPVTLTESHMQPTDIINNVKKDTTKTKSDYTPIIFRSEYDILHDSIVSHTHTHTYPRNNLDTIYEYSDDDYHDALDNAGDFVPGENFKAPI
tara:strand:- start:67 stop:639 length:573 start_codon:yes stop_codon:yes gene_type:complete